MKKLCVNIMKSGGLERDPFSGSAEDFKPTLEQFKEILCDKNLWIYKDPDPIPVRDNWMVSEPEPEPESESELESELESEPPPVPQVANLPYGRVYDRKREKPRLELKIGGSQESSPPSSTNVDSIPSIVDSILTCYGMDVDVKTAINEAKEAKEAADVQVTTAKAQVAAANRDKIEAEQAKIKALEAEAEAQAQVEAAQTQARKQAEAAQAEAQVQVEAAQTQARKQAEAAQAEAQVQVEAAQTQARKQAEAAKTEAEAKVRESQKRVLEVEQQLEEANQAKIEEETKTRNELQAEKEARTKAEEKVIADNSIIEQLNNDIKANNEQIKNMKYLGDGTKKTLDNLKGAMEKVADYIESIKDQISSDKMDQIYNISKINGVFESIKKLNESNGKDISMIFSSLLNFPEQIKDQIEKILIEGEDNNKREVISLLNRLIDKKGIVDTQKMNWNLMKNLFTQLVKKKKKQKHF